MDNLEKIVIRMPNWIGDLVMATPVLKDLKAKEQNHLNDL